MTCDRFFAAIPWPQFLVAIAVGFALGYLTARILDHFRRTPATTPPEVSMNERPLGMVWLENRPRLNALYFRYVPALVALMTVTVIGSAAGVTWLTFQRGQDQAALGKSNQQNAVVNCQNANESRRASLALWNFLFDTSLRNNAQATPAQRANIKAVRGWIGKLYADRDCTDLSRKYPIPPPPMITAPK